MADTILIVNAGSSSIKFSLYEIGDARTLQLASKGQLDGIGTRPRLREEHRWDEAAGLPLDVVAYAAPQE